MKRVQTPAQKEEAVYYSDFSGKCFGEHHPPVSLTLSFDYGSSFDGCQLKLDVDDGDVLDILDLIKQKLNSESKKELEKQHSQAEVELESAWESRDRGTCDYWHNSISLLDYILDNPTPNS